MEFIHLGETGEKISVVGFGGWAIGGHGYGKVEDTQSIVAINKALDCGINLFDTADIYGFGHSEEVLSKALGNRIKDVVVATKFGVRWDESGRTCKDCSVGYVRKALEGSLKRLKTECIPLYQLHWHDGVTPLSDVLEAMFRLREEGKIRHIGISNIPSLYFPESSLGWNVVSAQLQYSVADKRSSKDLAAFREKHRMATLAYSVLARGLLSGKYDKGESFGERDTRGKDPNFQEYFDKNAPIIEGIKMVSANYCKTPSQVAIRWVLDNPFVSCALVGIKNEEQVDENIGAIGWFLRNEDRDYLSSLGEDLTGG
jgi:myo-inositol catabolism protein IolS